jgi:hypothetical protein
MLEANGVVQWQTTWDRAHLFGDVSPRPPINFTTPGATGTANIAVDDTSTFQTVWGIGSAISE